MTEWKGTVLITGANGGLGAAMVEQIESEPSLAAYRGLYTVRESNSASTLKQILSKTPSRPHDIIDLDLSDPNSVRRTAEIINAGVAAGTYLPIELLILNAGFQDFGKQAWTPDGLDKTFTANYLGHWLLTLLLLRSIDKDSGRIVVIGSQAHEYVFLFDPKLGNE